MERREFLKFACGVVAGAAALATSAQAAPLSPQPIDAPTLRPGADAHPAVTTSEEAASLTPEQVHWHGGGHHWGWHRGWHRHWGWRRGWHHHWGWRRRWHRHHWRHW
jgi:hypothetical protein